MSEREYHGMQRANDAQNQTPGPRDQPTPSGDIVERAREWLCKHGSEATDGFFYTHNLLCEIESLRAAALKGDTRTLQCERCWSKPREKGRLCADCLKGDTE